jgi:hypothetical protein
MPKNSSTLAPLASRENNKKAGNDLRHAIRPAFQFLVAGWIIPIVRFFQTSTNIEHQYPEHLTACGRFPF